MLHLQMFSFRCAFHSDNVCVICFLKYIFSYGPMVHLKTIVLARWIQQVNPHSLVYHSIIFFKFPSKIVVLDEGERYDKSMMAAAQENKTTPSPSLAPTPSVLPFKSSSSLVQSLLIRPVWPSSHIYIKNQDSNRFSAFWIIFVVNFQVNNLTFKKKLLPYLSLSFFNLVT